MSYIENVLLADESIISKAEISWFVFAKPLSMLTAGILAFLYTEPFFYELFIPYLLLLYIHDLLYYLLAVWVTYEFVYAIISKTTTEVVVTNKRVITKLGLIARDTVEIQLFRVEACQVQQSIMGRILQYGSIVISGAGLGTHPISFIHQPTLFRKQLLEVLENKYFVGE